MEGKLNSLEFLVFKDLIDSCVSDEYLPVLDNMLKEYNDMKQAIKIKIPIIITWRRLRYLKSNVAMLFQV